MRGVVLGIVLVSSMCAAVSPPQKPSTEELLQALFDGIKRPDPYIFFYRFLDLEALFEEYPELEKQYKDLSPEEKKSLLETVEELNAVVTDIVSTLAREDLSSDAP